jgi:hypothetical protein
MGLRLSGDVVAEKWAVKVRRDSTIGSRSEIVLVKLKVVIEAPKGWVKP